jgi:hypothetical protein
MVQRPFFFHILSASLPKPSSPEAAYVFADIGTRNKQVHYFCEDRQRIIFSLILSRQVILVLQ